MSRERVQRRLAAIVATDVVGYSRMMSRDEAGTLARLKALRAEFLHPKIAEYGGRIVKTTGDGTLIEFPSAVDAVSHAIDVQCGIEERNASLPEAEKIQIRVGINVGDIILDQGDIYGDGVNVAARLEALAEPGGVCVASIVNESVGSRVDVVFKDGGEVSVKNIDRPIHVWKWHPGSDLVAQELREQAGEPARQHREQASIAVLPFDNMSGDPEQEYFSDGISEDIITDLSKIGGLTVIARNSSFAYKGKRIDIRTVARELGVTSVLEGSVRRAGNRVRINAQLIDAASGAHLWAERYDRELTDIFEVQDEVTRHIVDALKVKLTPGEAVRIAATPTKNLDAHDLFLRGRKLLQGSRWNRETFDRTVGFFTRAIELDLDFGGAYAGLSMAHVLDFQNHLTGDPAALEKAAHFAAVAIDKGPDLAHAHFAAANVWFWRRDLDKAKQEAETALALSPNDALVHSQRGVVGIYSGAPLEAIPFLEHSIRLDPGFAQQYLQFIGMAYLVACKYEAAAATFRERIRLAPETDVSRGLLISALGHLGEVDEARSVRAELKQVNPNYSFAAHLARLPFTNPVDAERIKEGFAKTGLSD